MTVSAWTLLAWLLGTLVITVAVVFAILFLGYRARVAGPVAQARTARYVFAYDDALQWLGVGYRERGRLTGELRANIAAAAADAPVTEVLARMGPAKELARAVAARRRGPTWVVGATAALATVVAQVVVTILMQLAFIAAVKDAADPGEAVEGSVLGGLSFEATMGADGHLEMFAATTSGWWLLLPVVSWMLWSRPWRLLTARRGDSVTEPA
jgi:hypothetical protein